MILILEEPGISVGKREELLMVKRRGRQKEVAVRQVESVVVLSQVQISHDAIIMLAERGIPILYMSGNQPVGAVMPFAYHGFVATRRAQFEAYHNKLGFELVLSILKASATNKARLLRYYARNRRRSDPQIADQLIEMAIDIEQIITNFNSFGENYSSSNVHTLQKKYPKNPPVPIVPEANPSESHNKNYNNDSVILPSKVPVESQTPQYAFQSDEHNSDYSINKDPPSICSSTTSSFPASIPQSNPIFNPTSNPSPLFFPSPQDPQDQKSFSPLDDSPSILPPPDENTPEYDDYFLSKQIDILHDGISQEQSQDQAPNQSPNNSSFSSSSPSLLQQFRQRLMGMEGGAANIYFQGLAKILPSDVKFDGRNRHPPKDPVNAALSFGYYLLEKEVMVALSGAGLEPYAGFLHADRSGRASLVYDLIEEFRQPVVDRLVVRIFQQKVLKPEDFESHGSEAGTRFSADALTRYLAAFYALIRKDGQKIGNSIITYQQLIIKQARKVVRVLLGKDPVYEGFLMPW
jgi:CRISPR/Cas system-associated endonuclease Cas1